MSERMFRAVVALVLLGGLALAVMVAVVLLPRSVEPLPSASTTASLPASPVLTAAPTHNPGPVFAPPGVVSVGMIERGSRSGETLVLQFLESAADAIPDAPGSFRVTLTDHAGDGTTVAFVGTPTVVAPDSLGATATLVAPNVLMVSTLASDQLNVELMTVSGLGIEASSTAALGSVGAELNGFTGSMVTGAEANILASPGSITARP
jgi:hypothetical protein